VSSKQQRVIVSVSNDLATDQRVDKVCTFIQNQGYEVVLLGRKLNNSLPLERRYQTKRFRLWFTRGPLFYAHLNSRLFWYLLFHRADILVANDLDTLLPNYLVSKLKKIKLVYDSHEYFTEVPELINRPKVQKIWLKIEEFIFPKLKHVMTVNTSIQEKYETKYHVPVQVVRNASPRWEAIDLKSKRELGIPEDKFILIFQGAGINVHRGAEEMTLAMKDLPSCCLLFVGDGDVVEKLKQLVSTNNLDNVLFFSKRPYKELINFTYHADLGLSLDKGNNPNYQFSLPNKLFDYIQTETPILASDVEQVKALIEKHQIGVICEKIEVDELVSAIKSILVNKEQYQQWKQNCSKAKTIECWEHETAPLNLFYPKI
jgi:glycosyltransferase involved in cell wall biosynthesis